MQRGLRLCIPLLQMALSTDVTKALKQQRKVGFQAALIPCTSSHTCTSPAWWAVHALHLDCSGSQTRGQPNSSRASNQGSLSAFLLFLPYSCLLMVPALSVSWFSSVIWGGKKGPSFPFFNFLIQTAEGTSAEAWLGWKPDGSWQRHRARSGGQGLASWHFPN